MPTCDDVMPISFSRIPTVPGSCAENGAIGRHIKLLIPYLLRPSWRPNVPESQLFSEKTWLQGAIIAAVTYGVVVALFILAISQLNRRLKVDIKHNGRASRQMICLLTYVYVTFILSTLAMASQAEITQLSFIENRDFPGGPAAYQESMFSIPINNLGNFCSFLVNGFSDSLLLWRCSVIYRSSRTSIWLVMAIPGLMLSASFVAGIILLERISRESSSPWTNTGFKFDLIYGAVTISLNTVLTLMIVIRLCLYRRRLTKLLGCHHAAHYTSIISILIESAAVSVAVSLWFLIPFAMGNQLANIPLSILFQVQAAASYMIIIRVAKGAAWTSWTAESEFSTPNMPEDVGDLSDIRFQIGSVEHPADSPVTSRSLNQLDGPRAVLDIESHTRGRAVYEGSPREPAAVIEKPRPNAN